MAYCVGRHFPQDASEPPAGCVSPPTMAQLRAQFDLGASYRVGSGEQALDKSRPMAYKIPMEFEWDDDKNNACLVRRGFDFAYAVRVFL